MQSPSTSRRAVSLVAWLVIAGLLIRIGLADGTFKGMGDPIPVLVVLGVGAGLVLGAVGLVLIAAFAMRAAWGPPLSLAAALLTLPYGIALLMAGHQSGSLIALAALAALIAGLARRPDRRPRP